MYDNPEYGLKKVINPIAFFVYLSYLFIISVVINGGGEVKIEQ